MQIPKWEYRFVPFALVTSSDEFEKKLNDAGAEGFAFAGVFPDDPTQPGGVILIRPAGYVELGSGVVGVALGIKA